jgi:hypothetical protein
VVVDEAAIDRATAAVYERLNPPSLPATSLIPPEWYRATAEAVLRAAGGQDAS